MQDDLVALFAFDRWANARVLDACRQLTPEQYVAEPIPGWSSVRSTIHHIAWVTELHLRTLAGDPGAPPPEAEVATVDAAARLLERAYLHLEKLTLSPPHSDWLSSTLTLRGSDPRIGDYSFTLPRWAMLRHIVTHSTYHRGQVASKLKRFGIQQPNTDFFFWAIEQHPPKP